MSSRSRDPSVGKTIDRSKQEPGQLVTAAEITIEYASGGPVLTVPTWSIDNAQRIGIVGSSGAGKTTFLKAILRENVIIAGRLAIDPTLREPGAIGYVSQKTQLVPWWTCIEHVTRSVPSMCSRDDAAATLEALGLSSALDKYPDQLSGGMARRLLLAMALVTKPKILMLDEALSALDPFTKADLVAVVDAYCNDNSTALLLVSHDLQEIVALVEEVCYVDPSGVLTSAMFWPRAKGLAYGSEAVSREAARLYGTMTDIIGRVV